MEILALNYFFFGGGGYFFGSLKKWSDNLHEWAWTFLLVSRMFFTGDYSMTVLHMSKPFPGAIYQQSHVGSRREIEKKQNK